MRRARYPEDAPLDPLGAYGRTKAAGERLVRAAHPGAHIVRTAWLYGQHGGNFARTMLRLASERDTVSVVTDQVGQPTWTGDLAASIVALLDANAPADAYHGTNGGSASWFDFARAVFEVSGLDPERVLPTDSSAFVRPAPRPLYSCSATTRGRASASRHPAIGVTASRQQPRKALWSRVHDTLA